MNFLQKILSNLDEPIMYGSYYYRKRVFHSGYERLVLITNSKFEQYYESVDFISDVEMKNIIYEDEKRR